MFNLKHILKNPEVKAQMLIQSPDACSQTTPGPDRRGVLKCLNHHEDNMTFTVANLNHTSELLAKSPHVLPKPM